MLIDSGVCPGVSMISRTTSPSSIRSPSASRRIGYSASALLPYPIQAPVRAAISRWPAMKSAWKWVLITPSIRRPCASASATYSEMSRLGSTITARPVVSSPIRYDAWDRHSR